MYSEMIKEIELALNQSQRLDKISMGIYLNKIWRKFISSQEQKVDQFDCIRRF